MAGCYTFSCDHCGFSVDSWEDCNRYLEWPIGTRNYLYHPSDIDETERLMREIYGHSPTPDEYMTAFRRYGGNETEFLCCGCLAISRIDEKRDLRVCSSCKYVLKQHLLTEAVLTRFLHQMAVWAEAGYVRS